MLGEPDEDDVDKELDAIYIYTEPLDCNSGSDGDSGEESGAR